MVVNRKLKEIRYIIMAATFGLLALSMLIYVAAPLVKAPNHEDSMPNKHHQTLMDEGIKHVTRHYTTTDELISRYRSLPPDAKHVHCIVSVFATVKYKSQRFDKQGKTQNVIALDTFDNDEYVLCFIDNDSDFKVSEFKEGDDIYVLGVACDARVKKKLSGIRLLYAMIDQSAPKLN